MDPWQKETLGLEVAEVAPIPPKAIVQFESGMRLMVDERMKWERDAG